MTPTPDEDAETGEAASEAPSAQTEAAEAEPVDDEIQNDDTASPDRSDREFDIDHAPEGEHGLEVSVSFTLKDSDRDNKDMVTTGIARAVEAHPEYDLIVVRAHREDDDPREVAPSIEAWFMPEHVGDIDLENPEESQPYENCYTCFAPGIQN